MLQNRPWRFNSVRDRFRYVRTHPELTAEAKSDCRYDAWAQLMAPFACIVITLFAIPAGIATGRQSVFSGILGALGMYFAFYGITIAFMVFAKNGWIAPVPAAVLPVATFFVLGLRFFYRQR
jgi:lipopolysaccharide export LptBFGC system permease protein LptF